MTPIEAELLRGATSPLAACPECGVAPFDPFLRGQVQRHPWPWWDIFNLTTPRPYCALICWKCKDIVGYE